jgi:hypothetical protein
MPNRSSGSGVPPHRVDIEQHRPRALLASVMYREWLVSFCTSPVSTVERQLSRVGAGAPGRGRVSGSLAESRRLGSPVFAESSRASGLEALGSRRQWRSCRTIAL